MFTFNRRKTSNTDQRTEYGKQKNRNVKAMNRHSFIMQQKTSTHFNITISTGHTELCSRLSGNQHTEDKLKIASTTSLSAAVLSDHSL
jgi:hypothetical protein